MKKGNRYKKKNKSKTSKTITYIMLVLFIAIFIYSGYKIIIYFKENIENDEVSKKISNYIGTEQIDGIDEKEYIIDFKSLKEINSDFAGFLKVNGTDIETIVVQSKNNSYYLNHNFYKQQNKNGWIFVDYRNKLDGTDKNVIIYGHNMKNGTMFASLKNILNKEWQDNKQNRYITFITENGTAKYEVFSVYKIENENYYITTDFNEEEFTKFAEKIKERSEYNFEVEVGENDNILTLSTCGNTSKYRIVLHAKKILKN